VLDGVEGFFDGKASVEGIVDVLLEAVRDVKDADHAAEDHGHDGDGQDQLNESERGGGPGDG
jgi:hypothetical protein